MEHRLSLPHHCLLLPWAAQPHTSCHCALLGPTSIPSSWPLVQGVGIVLPHPGQLPPHPLPLCLAAHHGPSSTAMDLTGSLLSGSCRPGVQTEEGEKLKRSWDAGVGRAWGRQCGGKEAAGSPWAARQTRWQKPRSVSHQPHETHCPLPSCPLLLGPEDERAPGTGGI